MTHRFVKWGIFLFFVLSIFGTFSNADNLYKSLTGNVILLKNNSSVVIIENLTEKINTSVIFNENVSKNKSNINIEKTNASFINESLKKTGITINISEEIRGDNFKKVNEDNLNIFKDNKTYENISVGKLENESSKETNITINISEENENIGKIRKIDNVIIGIKEPSRKKFFGMISKSQEEINREKVIIVDNILNDFHINKTIQFSSGGFEIKTNETKLKQLKRDSRIAFVEPVRSFSISLSEATSVIGVDNIWGMNLSGQNLTGVGQTVCVIDTGINYFHPDLIGRNATACNLDCIDKVCMENCSETDLNGHGTHVAGIVAASGGITGIAPGVNFIGLKVFPNSGQSGATTTGIINAIDWCVDNSETYNISVITMSLGTSTLYNTYCDNEYPSFNTSINNAYDKNISVSVSTGNGANTTDISSPACIPNVIPVADTYDANIGGVSWGNPIVCTDATTDVDEIVCHANRNSLVRLMAPGALINSTWYDGGYMEEGGTSMATPMVAGAIAIINQYLNLSGQIKTPSEIEDILNDTGKIIYDSRGSGENFSRINIHDAIFSLDIDSPNVTLVSPDNNYINLSGNQTFVCNASDWQLSNMTLKIWNSTGIYYNSTNNLTGIMNETNFSLIDIPKNTYLWNCLGGDYRGNAAYALTNFSLTIGDIITILSSPENESYTKINQTNFSCQFLSESNYELSNATFYLWNSTNDLTYNKTSVISGFDSITIFNHTFLGEDNYKWNCLGINNVTNSSWGASNFSIIYDTTNPNLTITSSPIGVRSSYIERNFGFNVSDNNLDNCSLIVNGVIVLTNSSINYSIGQSFSQTFTPGTYIWKINCSDYAGNVNSSSEDSFTITAPSVTTSNSHNGGGNDGGDSMSNENHLTGRENKNETINNNENETNNTKINDEDTAEFFAQKESRENIKKISLISVVCGIIVTVALIIISVVMLLYFKKSFSKAKKLKGRKTKKRKKKNGKKNKKA